MALVGRLIAAHALDIHAALPAIADAWNKPAEFLEAAQNWANNNPIHGTPHFQAKLPIITDKSSKFRPKTTNLGQISAQKA